MDHQKLSEEQIAVIFAMTSRRPEPFDEIQEMVTQEKAAAFHERWVLNYGHASVAEHAVIHMAVENISRLACDTLEDNRLGSYTEKSSRYQVLPSGYYHVPEEVKDGGALEKYYTATCQRLFERYEQATQALQTYLRTVRPQQEGERDSTYGLRLRREATDSTRFILPAATLSNVGVTMNARSLEHAIRKLLSAELAEEQTLGEHLKEQGRRVTPTLIKYTDRNDYLVETREAQLQATGGLQVPMASTSDASLVHFDPEAEEKVATAFLYHQAHLPYSEVRRRIRDMSTEERGQLIDEALERMGPHDAPIREMEMPYYTFEFVLDYGAYREFKRHRMQTYIAQPATTALGYIAPPLFQEAGLESLFQKSMLISAKGFSAVAQASAPAAQYLITHAHQRRMVATMNLRECYHLFKLRTQPSAHFSLVAVMERALEQARAVHPTLFKHLHRRS
jgi:thymidylate synthase ThyX